jgi:Trypsin-like peptidase domain
VSFIAETVPFVAETTFRSLRLRLYVKELTLGSATGFVVNREKELFLVTNYHVATGLNANTGEFMGKRAVHPEQVEVSHNAEEQLGLHQSVSEPLYDSAGRARWLEHPTLGERVDVVALPLTMTNGVDIYPHDPWSADPPVALNVTSDVSVVGFPFGRSSSDLAIWTRGTIASEFHLDHDDLPLYLIDSRTRAGQSGSPVVFFARFGIVPFENGDSRINNGILERFLASIQVAYPRRVTSAWYGSRGHS